MARLIREDPQSKAIDTRLKEWRQGDLACHENWFVHIGDGSSGLTPEAADAEHGVQLLQGYAPGLVVLTQTCDIVRSCIDRPFIEVAPLVEVSGEDALQVKRARRPQYAHIPALCERRLVAHLDRTMTVEKSVVAQWERTAGWSTDAEARDFAKALARKRARFAFPDDFVDIVGPLQDRISNRHEKAAVDGLALRALREIRVAASPSWDNEIVDLHFSFVRKDEQSTFDGKQWDELLEGWLALVKPDSQSRFKTVEGAILQLKDLTAQEYVESDPLDLDHLSIPRK
ncbi:hypothetical protein LVJ94_04220 [Pendulispora rubella]|uniref:Uncharacterized protein n=1 Tax=Pendulispora rubella TaxID=2741070 RepID=A0ABZ2L928_9BACT